MKKEKIFGIILGILYYVLSVIFYFYLFIIEALAGSISDFSMTLFYICYAVLPIILLAMPLILKFAFKKKFYKSIIYSMFSVIIYLIILVIMTFGIRQYFKTFSTEKWSNENWNSFRYLMIDDLEDTYDLVGMTKEEVRALLGEEDVELEWLITDYAIGYSVRDGFMEGYYYYIYLDENDVVVRTELNYWG